MDIKKEKQEDEEEDEVEDGEIRELLEKKKKLEQDLEIIYDKKDEKHEVFDIESSSASEKEEEKFKDEKLYDLDKILSKKIKNSSGEETVIIQKHYDEKVRLNVYFCAICEKSVDGETNLKTHIFGVRHLRNEVVWPTLDKNQSSRRSEGMKLLFFQILWND